MPLLMSPIDGSPMRQIYRHGIEIDVCPTSGGAWFDKGEIEKLIAILKEDAMNDQPAHYPEPQRYRDGGKYERYDDDDDRYDRDKSRYYKKSKMSRVMDIFDF